MMDFWVGFAGYAASGKDTAVQYLVDYYGYTRVSFADPLREFAAAVNPIVDLVEGESIRYLDALDQFGYDEAKRRYPEVRNFLQKVGTEGVRETFWDSFWVDLARKKAEEAENPGRVTFSDVRFPNEAEMVAERGYTVWIDRPGVSAVNAHASDNSLDDWLFNATVVNDGSIDDFKDKIDHLMQVELPLLESLSL